MKDANLARLFLRFRKHRSGKALAGVFDATARELLDVASHLVRNVDEAEDVVQTTFLVAIERADTFDARRSLRGWLYGILVREAAMARRRAARSVDRSRVEPRASREPVEELIDAEVPSILRRAVDSVPSPYREVLVGVVLEGRGAQEVARDLGRAPGTVRVQVQRGLDRLRGLLAREHGAAGVGMLPGRGLAAVREVVLRRAGVDPRSEPATRIDPKELHPFRPSGLPLLGLALALALAGVLLAWRSWNDAARAASRVETAAPGSQALRASPSGDDEDPSETRLGLVPRQEPGTQPLQPAVEDAQREPPPKTVEEREPRVGRTTRSSLLAGTAAPSEESGSETEPSGAGSPTPADAEPRESSDSERAHEPRAERAQAQARASEPRAGDAQGTPTLEEVREVVETYFDSDARRESANERLLAWGPGAVPLLRELALRDADTVLGWKLCVCIDRTESIEGLELLVEVLDGGTRIEPDQALEILAPLLTYAPYTPWGARAREALELDPGLRPALRKIAEGSSWLGQGQAAEIAASLDWQDFVPLIERMLKDPNLNLRRTAAEALEKLTARSVEVEDPPTTFPSERLVPGLLGDPVKVGGGPSGAHEAFFLPKGASSRRLMLGDGVTFFSYPKEPNAVPWTLPEPASDVLVLDVAGYERQLVALTSPDGFTFIQGAFAVGRDPRGAEVWRYEPALSGVTAAILYGVDGPYGVALGSSEGVVAMDPAGTLLWRYTPAMGGVAELHTHPGLPGTLLVLESGAPILLEHSPGGVTGGKLSFNTRMRMRVYASTGGLLPDAEGRPLLVVAGSGRDSEPTLAALDSGYSARWMASLSHRVSHVALLHAPGREPLLVVTTDSGDLFLLDPEGALLWRGTVPGEPSARSPISFNDVLAGPYGDGQLAVVLADVGEAYVYPVDPRLLPWRPAPGAGSSPSKDEEEVVGGPPRERLVPPDSTRTALPLEDLLARSCDLMQSDDVRARYDIARELQQAGYLQEALDHYLWLWPATRDASGWGGVRLSYLLSSVWELMQVHEPARRAFLRIRAELEAKVEQERYPYFDDWHEWTRLCDNFGEFDRVLSWYDRKKDDCGQLFDGRYDGERGLVARDVFQRLIEAGRADDAARLYSNPLSLARELLGEFNSLGPGVDEDVEIQEIRRSHLVKQLSEIHGVLVLARNDTDALRAAELLLGVLDTPGSRLGLVQAGLGLAGRALDPYSTWLDEAEEAGADVQALRGRLEEVSSGAGGN